MKLYDVYRKTEQILKKNPEASARDLNDLVEMCLGFDKNRLLLSSNETADENAVSRLFSLCEKRAEGYPVQYITGFEEFFGHRYSVGEGVLIPREDTVAVVEAGASYLNMHPEATVLDLCSGSGCIAISLGLMFPDCRVYAAELSETAFSYLTKNIERNGAVNVTPLCCDVLSDTVAQMFPRAGLIISNPPYICAKDMHSLQREVTFEPEMALYGGNDGLDFYRALIVKYRRCLEKDGMMAFETGDGQSEDVIKMMTAAQFYKIRTNSDINGMLRAVYGFAL